jgi:hypothetical protein
MPVRRMGKCIHGNARYNADALQLYCIVQVTQKAFKSVPALWDRNAFIRPFLAWRDPDLRSVRKHRERAKQY